MMCRSIFLSELTTEAAICMMKLATNAKMKKNSILIVYPKILKRPNHFNYLFTSKLAKRRSLILTRPVVKTGFNRSLLVDWWSIEVVDWVN